MIGYAVLAGFVGFLLGGLFIEYMWKRRMEWAATTGIRVACNRALYHVVKDVDFSKTEGK